MKSVRTFVVVPSLPEPLEPLRQLAYNLWWVWNPPALELFRRLDRDLWEQTGHNPVALLWRISQEQLEQAASDQAYMAQLTRVLDSFYIYMNAQSWFDENFPGEKDDAIAYFSAEFGLHECVPIYSGGLGVLAGDHLKAASDLGVPLVGVGLMYHQGYFDQQLTEDGWQLESYPAHDIHQWPATLVHDGEGNPVHVSAPLAGQTLTAQIWSINVGRVRLILLDADIPENTPPLRAISARLYGGDSEMRIRQEILLGVGGLRALRALGISPAICHMNEGHAAFLSVERIRQTMQEHGLNYREAREAVANGNIFTTHTPVPAGIDKFSPTLVKEHLGWMANELGISIDEFLALGREDATQAEGSFCMAVLALRMAYRANGVSKLHGEVARGMWRQCWPGVPREEIPITHVTNGIHTRTWLSRTMAELFDQYLGPAWVETPDDPAVWRRVDAIPDAELWRVHVRRRERLIATLRGRLRDQLKRRGAPPADIKAADEVLDPEALTIGFARRFAPYKRATLLFRNSARLAALLNDPERPVQLVFAGKAHPADGAGKELIKEVSAVCNRPEFRRRIVFLENHAMDLGRVMVQGVDVWLNNPLRLHEASGTSGMKVPPNGGLNLSCLDGWWPEAYNGKNGWAIGDGRTYDDLAYQDHVEGEALYNLLEREIIPLFYDTTEDGLPRRWIARIKESMKTICPAFNTHRMLREYTKMLYLPALRRYRHIAAEGFTAARGLAAWKAELGRNWHDVRIRDVSADAHAVLKVGDALPLTVRVHLGSVRPKDVSVEVYHGLLGTADRIMDGTAVPMTHVRAAENGEHVFEGSVPCAHSGRHGYVIRVVPHHEDVADRYDQGLLVWE
ncbi:MAG: alpha-glucan family phosphorylase [Planctomycetes bacterium]|nr:alpha-glucan family phosphorylase [Planctomycetota bacterium]